MPDGIASPPLIEIAIEAKSPANREPLAAALAGLALGDSSFHVKTDPESGQTVVAGMSELHLDQKLDTLIRGEGLALNVGAPQVAFLERVTRRAEVDYTHKKQSGGVGEFAAVSIVVEPNKPGNGNRFESRITDGAVPKQFVPAVEKGLMSVLRAGVFAGFPVVDVKVTLVDGKFHDVDSSAPAFEIAARSALREGLTKARSELLEPIMRVEVTAPEELVVTVIDNLKPRRARIQSQTRRGDAGVVEALVPLMNMFGYYNNLRELGRGRANFTMQFAHYAPVPGPDDDPPFAPAIGMRL